MPNRTFSANTSCNEDKSRPAPTPVDSTLTGHTIKVYADKAIYNSTTGNYVLPENVLNYRGQRGFLQ